MCRRVGAKQVLISTQSTAIEMLLGLLAAILSSGRVCYRSNQRYKKSYKLEEPVSSTTQTMSNSKAPPWAHSPLISALQPPPLRLNVLPIELVRYMESSWLLSDWQIMIWSGHQMQQIRQRYIKKRELFHDYRTRTFRNATTYSNSETEDVVENAYDFETFRSNKQRRNPEDASEQVVR